MFAINMRGVKPVRSYENASQMLKKAYGKEAPVPVGESFRIPGKPNSPQMSIRAGRDGDVIFRYHSRDVVTWHRDDSYTLRTWESVSTCTFFNALSPHWLTKTGRVLVVGDRCWLVTGSVHVCKGNVTGDLGKFTKQRVDRDAAKAALGRTRYYDYLKWYNTFANVFEFKTRYWSATRDLLDMLEDESKRVELCTLSGSQGTPAYLREAIYNLDNCYWEDTADTVLARDLNNWKCR